jgi:uncharacterized membrane protein YkoI
MKATIFAFIMIGTLTSIFTTSALFPNTFAIYSNSTTTTANTTTPKLLQDENNDYNDELSDHNLTKQVRIQPDEAILAATKNVSAQPSELRSLTLENENGHAVFSVDIFKPNSTQSVDVKVDAINGKVLRIDQDRDDNNGNEEEDDDEGEHEEER